MTLFFVLVLAILVAAVVAGFGMASGRRTRVIDRTYVREPVDTVDEIVEEPVATRRVRRRRVVR